MSPRRVRAIGCGVASLVFLISTGVHASRTPETGLGQFDGHGDVGAPRVTGSATYDAVSQEYRLAAAGVNMWGSRDEFHFVWKRLKGDFILRARVELVIARASIRIARRASSSGAASTPTPRTPMPSCTATVSPRSSTADRRERRRKRADPRSRGRRSSSSKRRGKTVTVSAARVGDLPKTIQISDLDLGDEVYLGLFLCSHNPDVIEKPVFRDVRIIRP